MCSSTGIVLEEYSVIASSSRNASGRPDIGLRRFFVDPCVTVQDLHTINYESNLANCPYGSL